MTRDLRRSPALLLAIALLSAPAADGLELSAAAFGDEARFEVVGLEDGVAREAIAQALAQVRAVEAEVTPDHSPPGAVARLNAAAGGAPQTVTPELADLLGAALSFCEWSGGAHGPLGGRLYELWGLRRPTTARPWGPTLVEARQSASCDQLILSPEAGTAQLTEGSQIDLWGFAQGFAVDRAVEALAEAGVSNGRVSIGGVMRAFGGGPRGRGWPVVLSGLAGLPPSQSTVWLKDRSLVVVAAADGRLQAGDDTVAPFVDQRTGEPPAQAKTVLVASERALDAEALAAALFILGSRQGQFRLGHLKPAPSVLWLVAGEGETALTVDYRWAEMRRPL